VESRVAQLVVGVLEPALRETSRRSGRRVPCVRGGKAPRMAEAAPQKRGPVRTGPIIGKGAVGDSTEPYLHSAIPIQASYLSSPKCRFSAHVHARIVSRSQVLWLRGSWSGRRTPRAGGGAARLRPAGRQDWARRRGGAPRRPYRAFFRGAAWQSAGASIFDPLEER
jgi:hypothetical protein